MGGHRVVISGTSGLAMTHVLRELKRRTMPAPRCCKAGKHFLQSVEKTGLASGLMGLAPERAMIHALQLPREILLRCWHTAFEKLADEGFPDLNGDTAEQGCNDRENIVLAAHACYYHQQSRAFVSLIDPDLLKKRFQPELVVTLVDDVENTFTRLRGKGHMFSYYDYGGFRCYAQACKSVAQLVHWRASEIAFADTLARALGCRHYVLAVKHPVETLRGLLFDPGRPRVYLSHPISEPRRKLADGDQVGFDKFCAQLECTAAQLRTKATLFEPTTIDEFRFHKFKVHSPNGTKPETVYVPALTPRWPMPCGGENLLWSSVPDENPVDPTGYFTGDRLAEFETRAKSSGAPRVETRPNTDSSHEGESHFAETVEVEHATHLVAALVGEIGRSVTARDLKLVEQSDHLAVVRPHFNGHASGGVQAEIDQHCKLIAGKGRKRGGIWVFTSQIDEETWRRGQVAYWLHRKYLKRLGASEDEARLAVTEMQLGLKTLGKDPASLMAELQDQMAALLGALNKVVLDKCGKGLVSVQSDSADDRPLTDSLEVSGVADWKSLTEDLLDFLTPRYLGTPSQYEKNLDVPIPVTIYWGAPWPRAQDIVDFGRALDRT